MTHPPAGPSTPPPPSGPRYLTDAERANRAIAAETAGSYGRSAEPLTSGARTFIYRAQIGRHRLTPRQRRRRDHKENRAYRGYLAA